MNKDDFKNNILNYFLALLFASVLAILQISHTFSMKLFDFKQGHPSPLNIVMPPFTGYKVPTEGESILYKFFYITKGEILSKIKVNSIKIFIKDEFPFVEVAVFVFIYFMLFLFFLIYIDRNKPNSFKRKILLFLITFLIAIAVKLTSNYSNFSIYYLPFIGITGLYLIFFDKRVAVSLTVLQSFIISIIYYFNPFLLFSFLCSSLFSMMFYKKNTRDVTYIIPFITGTFILALGVFLFGLYYNQIVLTDLKAILWTTAFLPFAFLLIQILKIYSPLFPRYDIMSYLNLDNPLLKLLKDKAPGTYQHSLSMANLAETAASSIEADGLLCRVGAYYHDIGKMLHAEYFIENQQGENPHNVLSPQESARMIKLHVSDGLQLAKEYKLPEYISQFIDKHHGSTLLEYFYEKAKITEKEVSVDDFKYPGRKPDNKETAILMIVDAIEAASRTIKEPTVQNIEAMVSKITFNKLLYSQLNSSTLTITELRKITLSLIESIKSNSHARIEYPWQKQDKKGN